MGKTNIYGAASNVCIQAHASSTTWLFGFRTKLDAAEKTLLGHADASGATLPVIYGLNSPRPAIFKKVDPAYTVTSYADHTKATAAIAGYKKVKPVKMRSAKSARSKCVTVPFKGAKYTWMMNEVVYAKITVAVLNTLGVADAVNTLAAAKEQIWGGNGSTSKPPRAKHEDATGTVVSTFYDETLALPSGWEPAGGGGYTL